MARKVEKIYGNALFEAAKASGRLQAVRADALALLDAYSGKGSPHTATEKLSAETAGLIATVMEKGRLDALPEILCAFLSRADEDAGIGNARVITASALSEAKKQEIREKLLSTTKFTELSVSYEADPSIIGGMIVFVGDRMADGSVKTKLEKMKNELLSVKITEG